MTEQMPDAARIAQAIVATIDFDGLEETIAAAIRSARAEQKEQDAKILDERRPSAAQLEISPDYNNAVVRALEWAAAAIRSQP